MVSSGTIDPGGSAARIFRGAGTARARIDEKAIEAGKQWHFGLAQDETAQIASIFDFEGPALALNSGVIRPAGWGIAAIPVRRLAT